MLLCCSLASASFTFRNPSSLSVESLNYKMYTIYRSSLISTDSSRMPQKQFTKKYPESRLYRASWFFLTGIVTSISCARLTVADSRQRNSPSGSKRHRKCNNHVWYRCSTRKHHVPATVNIFQSYQRSVVDSHCDWIESVDLSSFADWQEPGRQQSRLRLRLSI